MQKTILSLYDFSGNWAKPYRDNGYEVIQVDISRNKIDSRLMKFEVGRNIYGILAAPPCTYFSQARRVPTDNELLIGLSTLDVIFRMVAIHNPKFYCIENPEKSRIWRYIGKPKQTILLSWYGYESKKPTSLFGNFNRVSTQMELMNLMPTKLENIDKSIRSTTPPSFAQCFYEANK